MISLPFADLRPIEKLFSELNVFINGFARVANNMSL